VAGLRATTQVATTGPLTNEMASHLPMAASWRRSTRRPGWVSLNAFIIVMDEPTAFNGHAGEIVVLAGLVGSGRSEVARAEYFVSLGGEPPDRGIAPIPEIFHLD
jgi:hypothetical protein